jgi:BirA family biotin operon repressor/biotin-[acetyl-CoA-carboxylase] ligase
MNATRNIISPNDIEIIKADSFVRTVEFHRELPSTNDLALQRAALEDLDTPLLLLTELQTAGRGRGNNQWWSAPGSLTFSLVIGTVGYESTGAFDPRLSLATALAMHDTLQEFVPLSDIRLKWPNDVYLGSRKVAGILLERPATRSDRLVVGIGVNINNSFSEAPEQIQAIGTSLYDASGTHHVPGDVLRTILKRLVVRYKELATGELRLVEEWREHCMLRNRTVHVASGNQTISGLCHGIDDQGALIIEAGSTLHRLKSGTIQRVEGSEADVV